MADVDAWAEGAVRCFLSYQTIDSNDWNHLGPSWAAQLEERLLPRWKKQGGVEVFHYTDSSRHTPGDWRELLRRRVRTCDIFIALVTDHYLDYGQEAIGIELNEIRRRQDAIITPILITGYRPTDPPEDWDHDLMWIFDQNGCTVERSELGRDGKTPHLSRNVSDAILSDLELVARARREKVSATRPAPPPIASALTDVYAAVGLGSPVSLPAGLIEFDLSGQSEDQLRLAAEELAVLLDERASNEVIQAWARRFIA